MFFENKRSTRSKEKKGQEDFPDNSRIMVLMVCPLAFMTALLKHKTSEKSN